MIGIRNQGTPQTATEFNKSLADYQMNGHFCRTMIRSYLRFFCSWLLLIILAAIPRSISAAPAPVTHEDLWLMKRVGTPEPSPDGRWVVFAVVEPAYEEKEERANLWIVPADGSSTPRRLTAGKGKESSPAWSPDSSRIAFVTRREGDESAQVYLIDIHGGEARRISQSVHGARRPVWSPDGRWILFQSSSYRDAVDEEQNRKMLEERKKVRSKVRIYDGFPIRRWDKWLDDQQSRILVLSPEGKGAARDLLGGSKLAAEPGFRGAGDEGSGDSLQPVWAPDSKSVVFVASTNFHTAAFNQPSFDLYQVGLDEKEPRRLTSGTLDVSQPAFAPDGRHLCFVSNLETANSYYGLQRIFVAPWPWNGKWQPLTAEFDRSIEAFDFSADGKSVLFTAEDEGHVRVWSMPVSGGQAQLVVNAPQGTWGAPRTAKKSGQSALFATWGAAHRPVEIHRADPSNGKRQALTAFNEEKLSGLDLPPLSGFWTTNKSGRRIYSLLVYPPAFDERKKYPLLVMIHGGHASMNRDAMSLRWNVHLLTRPGYVMVLPDYVGSTGYGEKFTLDILGDPLRGPADDINAVADEAIRRFGFVDGSRQAAAGASYGGHLVNWLEATTTRYKCLIGHAGLASLYAQWSTSDMVYHRELMMGTPFWANQKLWGEHSPASYADQFKTPLMLSIGESDYRVPLNNVLEMWTLIQRQKVPGRLLVWPDENHWILKGENSRVFYKEVHSWLEKWLGPSN